MLAGLRCAANYCMYIPAATKYMQYFVVCRGGSCMLSMHSCNSKVLAPLRATNATSERQAPTEPARELSGC